MISQRVLEDFSDILAEPVTAVTNSAIRERTVLYHCGT
jgi:hypothetical protein